MSGAADRFSPQGDGWNTNSVRPELVEGFPFLLLKEGVGFDWLSPNGFLRRAILT